VPKTHRTSFWFGVPRPAGFLVTTESVSIQPPWSAGSHEKANDHMSLRLALGFWPALAGFLALSLILSGCGGAAAPVTTPVPQGAPQAAQESATPEKADAAPATPIVVLPPDKDRALREELAALLPTPIAPSPKVPPDTEAPIPQEPAATEPARPEAPAAKDSAATTQIPDAGTPIPEATPQPTSPPTATPGLLVGGMVGDQAADIRGIVAWINSEPLSMADLRGKVVLVDFWTYTCINCIRTFPFLKQWNARYEDDGLVIIGVHTPEFKFEEVLENVVQATQDNSIVWPVALDNRYVTWRGYSNRFWPAKYLIDKEGVVRYTHFGEGQYAETEEKIRELLAEIGADLSDDTFALPEDQTVDPVFKSIRFAEVTRELYAGYERGRGDVLYGRGGYVVQKEYYENPDTVITLKAPGDLLPHLIYFNGPWRIGPQSAKHGRASTDYGDYLELVYSARSVNAVLTSESGEPYKVRITIDGEFLTEDNKGADITIGEDGESFILVTEPRMYNILENPSYVQRETLRMSSMSADFGLFAFTFGVYRKSG